MAPPILSEMKSSSLPAPDSPIQYGNISCALGIFHWSIALLLLCLARMDLALYSAGTVVILLGFIILVVTSLAAIVCGHLGRRKEQQKRRAALAGLWLGYTELILFPIVIYSIFLQFIRL